MYIQTCEDIKHYMYNDMVETTKAYFVPRQILILQYRVIIQFMVHVLLLKDYKQADSRRCIDGNIVIDIRGRSNM